MTIANSKMTDPRDHLIVALDVPTPDDARAFVDQLGDAITHVKVGMELSMHAGFWPLVDDLVARQLKVFVDLKLFDIPQTVANATAQLCDHGVRFATIHGNQRMMEAAAKARGNSETALLAVTVLTSLDQGDLDDLGFDCDAKTLVLSRAKRAVNAGMDGVVASGQEAAALRSALDQRPIIVTPGIRPIWNDADDDQSRVVTPKQAIESGANHIVVGRPIRDAENRQEAARRIVQELS